MRAGCSGGHYSPDAVTGEAAVSKLHRTPVNSTLPPLFSVADVWVRLTGGPRLSVTLFRKLVHLFLFLCVTLEIDKLRYRDPKFVNQIL